MTGAALGRRVGALEKKLAKAEAALEVAVQRAADATQAGAWVRELEARLAGVEQRRAEEEQAAREMVANRPPPPKLCPDCGGADQHHFDDCRLSGLRERVAALEMRRSLPDRVARIEKHARVNGRRRR